MAFVMTTAWIHHLGWRVPRSNPRSAENHPGNRRVRENVPVGLEPVGIVKRPAAYALEGSEAADAAAAMEVSYLRADKATAR